MRILVDKEWVQKITQMTDALLKAYWNEVLGLVNSLLKNIEDIPEEKVKEKEKVKEIKGKVEQNEEKPKK